MDFLLRGAKIGMIDLTETPRVYIAGPYTKGDVAINVRRALDAANELINHGFVPFIPHLTHFLHMSYPRSYAYWLAYDKVFISLMHALLRLSGESAGADSEVEYAKKIGIPVFYNVKDLRFGKGL